MKVLFATDFSAAAAAARCEVIRLARLVAGEVVVVHVLLDEPFYPDRRMDLVTGRVDPTHWRSAEAQLESELRLIQGAAGVKVRGVILRGEPARQIVRVAAHERADLVVMGTHGAGLTERFFVGSVAGRVIRTESCPVMTVRPTGPADETERGTDREGRG